MKEIFDNDLVNFWLKNYKVIHYKQYRDDSFARRLPLSTVCIECGSLRVYPVEKWGLSRNTIVHYKCEACGTNYVSPVR